MPSMSYFKANNIDRFSSTSNHVNKSMSNLFWAAPTERTEYQKAASGNISEEGKARRGSEHDVRAHGAAECKTDPK